MADIKEQIKLLVQEINNERDPKKKASLKRKLNALLSQKTNKRAKSNTTKKPKIRSALGRY